ncbi:MAG: ABC transporter permease [Rhodospirillaceae bacterium]|nr:MAG: ABC transporter permease [Rhodospirillaceae bacterium]
MAQHAQYSDKESVPPASRGKASRQEASRVFALAMALPMAVWQCVFFVAALAFLAVMAFWSVQNFRVVPDFTFANWVKMFSAGYFQQTYLRTFGYGAMAAAISSVLAFPCAYGIAFKLPRQAQRLVVACLIIPYFTSYLVRTFAWKILLTDNGVINAVLGWVGLGPFSMMSNLFAVMIGYLTLIFPIVILLQYFSLANIDRRLIEAAHNLRCGAFSTVFRVVIPSAKIGLILAATFAFILSFGDFVSPSFLGNNKPPTLSILMVDAVKSGSQWPRAAVVALSMIATLVAVAFLAMSTAYSREGRR